MTLEKDQERKLIHLTGQKYGRLLVIKFHEIRKGSYYWNCVCECGNTRNVTSSNLKRGLTKSCGCLNKELVKERNKNYKTHGLTKTTEYRSWNHMKQRCSNPKNEAYIHYGERGITICERWLNSFENFLEDMGKKPSEKYSINRIDNNLGYYKENCVWSTSKEQNNNTRFNIKVINTETNEIFPSISKAAKSINISHSTLYGYLNGSSTNKTKFKLC